MRALAAGIAGSLVATVLVAAGMAATVLTPFTAAAQQPRVHVLEGGPTTVAWGYYWSEAPPVLRIESGDIVEMSTFLTSSPDRLERAGIPPDEVEPALRAVYDQVTERGPGGHILTGPVYVEGAEPGDVLEVRILSVEMPLAYGYNGCSGFIRDLCEGVGMKIVRLDRDQNTAEFLPGVTVPLAPFFGSMGVAPPPEAGRWHSTPPWIHAGNIDNKEMVAGTTLFIPVHVPGALFQAGDGHAAQGDGEVDQTGIETSLRGRFQFIVRKDMSLEWPRGETATHHIAMGSDEDLAEATRIAIRQAVALLGDVYDIAPGDAYQLVSVACDLRITQLVDRKVGVHVMIPKSLF
jgi:acetamidase/formamidase